MKKPNKSSRSTQRRVAKHKKFQAGRVFDIVYSFYEELEAIHGTISCAMFYKKLAANKCDLTGKHIPKSGLVTVTASDFLADVYLALKSVLSAEELSQLTDGKVTEGMRERAGKEFIRRKIHPLNTYMRPKDMR